MPFTNWTDSHPTLLADPAGAAQQSQGRQTTRPGSDGSKQPALPEARPLCRAGQTPAR